MTKQRPIYGHKHVFNVSYVWQKQRFQHLTLNQRDEHMQVWIRKQDNLMTKSYLEIIQIQIGMMEILCL